MGEASTDLTMPVQNRPDVLKRREAWFDVFRPAKVGLTHVWNGPTGEVLLGGLIQFGAVESYVRPFGAGL